MATCPRCKNHAAVEHYCSAVLANVDENGQIVGSWWLVENIKTERT